MREPVVANRFYPGSIPELNHQLNDLFEGADSGRKQRVSAVVVPHAGYIYSGQLAANTLSKIEIPDTVLLIGPKHTRLGAPVALSPEDWQSPLGVVKRSVSLCNMIHRQSTVFSADSQAHLEEHSLEVMLPLLQHLQPGLRIAALAVAHIKYRDCKAISAWLSEAINAYQKSGKDLLMLASSDMNHFESRKITQKKDWQALDAIQEMDPEKLYDTVVENNISMCGMIPVVITMLTVMELGGNSASIVGHTDSGSVSGNTDQVVGYAGVLFS